MDEATLPHDDRIERALIGCLLLEPHRAFEVATLPVTAFYSTRHRTIFRALAQVLALRGAADLQIVFHHLVQTGQIVEAGEYAYISTLIAEHGWKAANLKHYATILRELALRRDAILGASAAAEIARKEGVEAVQAALSKLSRDLESNTDHQFRFLDIAAAARGEIPDIPWLVEGWLGRGDATFFGGEWGMGKSLVALDLALSLAAGIPWLGRMSVVQPCAVLYMDEENNPVNAQRRLGRMMAGRGLDPELALDLPLHYGSKNRVKLDVPAGYATVERLVGELGIKVIVMDSFIRFGRLNASKNDELARFFDVSVAPLIGKLDCAVVMLDHMRKPGEGDDKSDVAHRITGGADKSGFADNVWVIHGGRDDVSRTFEARKNRWEDTLPPPLTTKWEVSEDERSARVVATDATLNAEAIVLGALLDAGSFGLYASEVYEACERRSVPRRTAIRTVKRMATRGAISKELLAGNRVRYAAR